MLDLRKRSIGIRLVDKGIEFLHRLPNSHFGHRLGAEVFTSFEIEGHGLLFMLLLVEATDTITCAFILPELDFVLSCVPLRLLRYVFSLFCLAVVGAFKATLSRLTASISSLNSSGARPSRSACDRRRCGEIADGVMVPDRKDENSPKISGQIRININSTTERSRNTAIRSRKMSNR